jgi:hypothetical protein
MFEMTPEDIGEIYDFYAGQAVCDDGHFFNIRRGRCSLRVSPQTLDHAISALGQLVHELRLCKQIVKVEMGSLGVPYVFLWANEREVPIGVKELKSSLYDDSSKAILVVPKLDPRLSGTLKYSCRIGQRYLYWDISKIGFPLQAKTVAAKIIDGCRKMRV